MQAPRLHGIAQKRIIAHTMKQYNVIKANIAT